MEQSFERSFIEKQIRSRAEDICAKEIRELHEYLMRNPIAFKIEIGDKRLVANYSNTAFDELITNELKESRIAEIEKEETQKLIRKLEGIEYLFNQM